MGECDGRIALVTGASRGIGAAIAERLAAAGARVALVARSLDTHPDHLPGTLAEVVARIRARGGIAVPIQGDIADASARTRVVQECEAQLGPVDILVNNAAVGWYRPFLDLSAREFATTFDVNVRAPFHLCQCVVPAMRTRRRGWILNISSATAAHPAGPPFIPWETVGGHLLYAASKAALDRVSTGLAAELHPDGIAVNALSPVAAVITPGLKAMGIEQFLDDSMIEPVEAIAEAALALCSGDPSTLTGRVSFSLPLLAELGRSIRALDGGTLPPR